MRVLVTGANGFIGSTLCAELQSRGHEVRAAVRTSGSAPAGTSEVVIGDIDETTDWSEALAGQEAVVHLAARVHVMVETAEEPLKEFRRTNTAGTLHLAQASQDAGISRFVFLSSIKANGEVTTTAPFTVLDRADPQDPYGISKLEAEAGIEQIANNGSTNFSVIRTPLVYGPGVGGNFQRLLKIVDKRLPIPLAGVKNRRTMVSIWNLSDLIAYLLTSHAPKTQLVLAGDKEQLSTPALIRAVGHGLGKPARLLWFPVSCLVLIGKLTRRSAEFDRLLGSLEVSYGSTAPDFDWQPKMSAQDGIDRTASAWQHQVKDQASS